MNGDTDVIPLALHQILYWLLLQHVPQRKEHPDQKQRFGAVQQPRRAAPRATAPHLLHGRARQRGQHGERLLGRPQLFPPRAAVQGAQCRHKHVAHHAGQSPVSAAAGASKPGRGALETSTQAFSPLPVSKMSQMLGDRSSFLLLQAAFCVLPSRDLLVVTSQKGIQVSSRPTEARLRPTNV